ncbi:MAG TPA: phosphoribosylformylglycinamidine synthase, partial [Candidatus Marinimicrobia bacterium]|nr:phosphoribosylformylglycinamidine synthase [Candidatus Neomarinimicrobiota bacterium]HJL78370.1 phosphoribosylformylglycinamidine synthase [Candidatus Neomarinimicrobiota bacterium]
MHIAIIQFPGSNTERETLMACRRVGLNPVEFLWNDASE